MQAQLMGVHSSSVWYTCVGTQHEQNLNRGDRACETYASHLPTVRGAPVLHTISDAPTRRGAQPARPVGQHREPESSTQQSQGTRLATHVTSFASPCRFSAPFTDGKSWSAERRSPLETSLFVIRFFWKWESGSSRPCTSSSRSSSNSSCRNRHQGRRGQTSRAGLGEARCVRSHRR